MKKTVFFAVMCIGTAVFAASADDFSKTPWTTWTGKGATAKATINKQEGCAAKGALQLVYTKGNRGGLLKNFPVEPNTFYKAEIMVKSSDPDAVFELAFHDFGEDNKYKSTMTRQSFSSSATWKKISYSFLTGSKTKFVRVMPNVRTKTNTPAFFDDFKLAKTELFEFKDSFEYLSEWGLWTGKNAKTKLSLENNDGKNSKTSAKLTFLKAKGPKNGGTITRNFSILPGRTYTFSVYVKAKGVEPKTRIALGFQSKDEKFKYIGLPIPSTFTTAENCSDWKQMVLTRKIPTEGKWGKVRNILVTLSASGANQQGEVLFDDFELFEEETEE